MNDAFAKRLKELRKSRGKTQQQMAETLKVLRSTYGEYERGKIAPPMDKLQSLASYFDVSIDYLIGNINVKRSNNEMHTEDINESLARILDSLQNRKDVLTFEWETLNDDSRELLINSIENSLKMVKILKKGRK